MMLICFFILTAVIRNGFSSSAENNIQRDSHGRVKMGQPSQCDDGKSNLEVDWDINDSEPYTCNSRKNLPWTLTEGNRYFLDESENYPDHACMTEKLDYQKMYNDPLPTSGTHRPIWPVYGSYIYCPPQRWLHSLEHGAVVMLYHPCARPKMVTELKKLVENCLRRHIITPSKDLPDQHPFALLTWQNKFYLNHFNKEEIIDFIKKHALKGREDISDDGIYKAGLLKTANFVSGSNEDSNICPNYSN